MKKVNNNKGVTLVALTITVVILLIVTNIIIYNVKDNLGIEKLKNLQNDIEELNDKISIYYTQYGNIPAKYKYDNIDNIRSSGVISDVMDTGDFYVIDLSAIENLTLTYGKDYEQINADGSTLNDVYIINENSHNIFYAKGVSIKDQNYYTNYTKEDIDNKNVDLRYVDNIKIPEGYTYVEGSKESGIIIRENESGNQYVWIVVNDNITKIPSDIDIDSSEEERFIKSVNLYNGYYKIQDGGNSVKYFEMTDTWSEKYDVQAQYKDKNGDIAIIPKGFKISKTKGKDTITEGLVIQDDQENSYVWIAVPKSIYSDEKYIASNDENKVTSDTDYNGIYNILSEYSSEFRNSECIDKWYALDGTNYITEDTENLTTTQKNLTNGCGLNYDEYINSRNNMLKSIYNNGGFWISQYEIGTSTNETSSNKSIESKKGMYVYNNVTCAEAQELSKNIKPEESECTSSLLFGIQWDLACKFIEENSNKTKIQLTENSKTLGNYQDSAFNIKEGKYSSDDGAKYIDINETYEKTDNSSILFTTGASEINSVLNIYDLAGNIEEITLEQSKDPEKKVTVRGGSYLDTNSNIMSHNNILNDDLFNDIGFRIGLY